MKLMAQTQEFLDIESFEGEIAQLTGKSNDELYELVMSDSDASPLMLVLVERLRACTDEMTRVESHGKQHAIAQDA